MRRDDLIEVMALYEQWSIEQGQYRGAWEEHEGLGPDLEVRLIETIASPELLCVVHDASSVLTGAAVAALTSISYGSGVSSVCQVEWLFVQRDQRLNGIASRLWGAAEVWSRDSGAVGIEMGVLPGHRDAKNFCEHNGLKARLLVMAKRWD